MNNFEDRANWTPVQARSEFRQNNLPGVSTGDIAMGHVQASVAILQSSIAGDFAKFCEMNPAPCPLLYQAKPGEVDATPLASDSDIRVDLPMYSIMENGTYTKVVPDILCAPFDDLVSFYIGCSYSFEHALKTTGLPLRHIDSCHTVPAYITDILCYSAGPFAANLVVTMRSFPKELVQKAVEATADLHLVHGAPVHIGDPCWIGIKDFARPDYNDAPVTENGDVCLFWACGNTTGLALRDANLPLAIGIGPKTNGCMFITDHKLADFFKAHPPEHSSLKPRVIYISKEPVFGSIISYKALEEVQELEKATNQESLKVMDFVKRESAVSLAEAAMILNHASSIAVFAFDEQLSEDSFNVLSIIKAAMATRSKKVVLLVPESKVAKWKEIISCCFDRGILRESVRTFQLETVENIKGNDGMYVVQTVAKTLPFVGEFMTEDTNPRKFTAVVGSQKQGNWVACISEVMNQHAKITSSQVHSTWPGHLIAKAIFILNSCPIHSRYARRGLGPHTKVNLEDYIIKKEQLEMNHVTFEEN